MKKASSIVTGSIVSVLLFGGSALAADHSITNTGPNSSNQITSNSVNHCTQTNTNNVHLSNNNSQVAISGSANSSGNTTGGSAQSGTATNTSSSSFNLSINNGNGCVPQTTTPGGNNGGGGGAGGSGEGHVSGVSQSRQVAAAQQVAAPVGGVGAGAGGLSTTILSLSLLSGALGLYRLRKFQEEL